MTDVKADHRQKEAKKDATIKKKKVEESAKRVISEAESKKNKVIRSANQGLFTNSLSSKAESLKLKAQAMNLESFKDST